MPNSSNQILKLKVLFFDLSFRYIFMHICMCRYIFMHICVYIDIYIFDDIIAD